VLDWRHPPIPKVVSLPLKSAADPLRALAFIAAALVCGALANGLAAPDRKLAWRGWTPPPETVQAPARLEPLAPAPEAPVAAPGPTKAVPAIAKPSPMPSPARNSSGEPPPVPVPSQPSKPVAASSLFPPSPASVVRDISSGEAYQAFQLKVPFLDARRSSDFAEGHIPGAWSAPVWEADLERRLIEFEAAANPGLQAPIGIYCTGGGCEDSRLLARKLVDLGYRNLLIYRDGFPDWVAKGRPQATGAHP